MSCKDEDDRSTTCYACDIGYFWNVTECIRCDSVLSKCATCDPTGTKC
jgi:hypothetical protein